mmetsp:Transcript_48030/g.79835  ORF Transcript_48030/g.79835 Transcript_48030/m.79835 type:complete len:265 (+) Transcript_48030:50-844(+)
MNHPKGTEHSKLLAAPCSLAVHAIQHEPEKQNAPCSDFDLEKANSLRRNENVINQGVCVGPFKITWLTEDFFLRICRYEIANAVSMIVPSLVSYILLEIYVADTNRFAKAICLAPVIHFPFSFCYHGYMALPNFKEDWALLYHRLDSAFIHAASSVYAYGISCSLGYGLLTAPANAVPVCLLWRSTSRVPNTRMMQLSVTMYLMPYLWQGMYLSFILVAASFFVILKIWEKKYLGAIYHSGMHVMMGLPQALMVASALGLLPSI